MATLLEYLMREHETVSERAQLLEKATMLMGIRMRLSQSEYQRLVIQCRRLIRKTVTAHFSVEEYALFPIYRNKSSDANKTVSELIKEHSEMFDRFIECRKIGDYNQSIKALSDLMNSLALHAKKEDHLFSSVSLESAEVESALRGACAIGLRQQRRQAER